jgi:hypothetical protein
MIKKLIFGIIAGLIAAAGIYLVFYTSNRSNIKDKTDQDKILKDIDSVPDIPVIEIEKKVIFFAAETEGEWVKKEYSWEKPKKLTDSLKTYVNLLLKGDSDLITPIIDELTLRALYYIAKQKLLIIDMSEHLSSSFPGGSAAEIEFIYYLVNNICYNYPEIKKVKFLIAGNESGVISGHLDLEQPFYPKQPLFKYEQ